MELWVNGSSTGSQGNGASVAPAAAGREALVIQDLLENDYGDKFNSWSILLEQWWAIIQEVANVATAAKGPSGPSASAAAAAIGACGLHLKLSDVSELVSTIHSCQGLNLLDYHTVSRGLSEVETWPEAVPPKRRRPWHAEHCCYKHWDRSPGNRRLIAMKMMPTR